MTPERTLRLSLSALFFVLRRFKAFAHRHRDKHEEGCIGGGGGHGPPPLRRQML